MTPAIAITLRGLFFFLLVPREIDEAGHDSFPLPRPLIRHRNTVDTITITNDAFETSAQFGITSQGKKIFLFRVVKKTQETSEASPGVPFDNKLT